jgi:hypothetical protein
MTKNKFEWDGQFDWILKKEGKQEQLHSLLIAPKDAAPLPRTATINEFREERKESRTNLGAQLMGEQRKMTFARAPHPNTNRVIPMYNEFANAP